ncbi:hypothetical protein GBA52_029043 [Prunus armeniaca]|nr:hypothetical protein GBA52_029043 [Prunus armeniaca]
MIDSEKSKLAFQKQMQADPHCSGLFTFRPLPQTISALLLLLHFRNGKHLLNLLLKINGPILWLWNSTLSPLSEFSRSKSATSRRCGARLALGGKAGARRVLGGR